MVRLSRLVFVPLILALIISAFPLAPLTAAPPPGPTPGSPAVSASSPEPVIVEAGRSPGPEELAGRADLVVLGTVTGISSYEEGRGNIYRVIQLAVEETVKGQPRESVALRVPGGEVNGHGLWVSEAPEFGLGERVAVFLKEKSGGVFEARSHSNKFTIQGNRVLETGQTTGEFVSSLRKALGSPGTGRMVSPEPEIVPAGLLPQITSISPSWVSAGTGSEVTITGSNFGTVQGAGYVNFWRGPLSTYYVTAPIVSWSDTRIVSQVPRGASSARDEVGVIVGTSAGASAPYPIHITYSYGGAKWVGSNPMGEKFLVNENTLDTQGELQAVLNAMQAWNSVSDANYYFEYGGPTTGMAFVQNDRNEIFWLTLPDAQHVAEAWIWYQVSGDNYEMVECDIGFNDYYTWENSAGNPAPGNLDIQTVAAHELGHALYLMDMYGLDDRDKMMYGYTSAGTTKRGLAAEDIDALRYVYPGAGTRGQFHVKVTNYDDDNLTVNYSSSVTGAEGTFLAPAGQTVNSPWQAVPAGSRQVVIRWTDPDKGYEEVLAVTLNVPVESDTEFAFTIPASGTLSVSTGAASEVTASGARLNGTLISLGGAPSATLSFQWGTARGVYANETPATDKNGPGSFYFNLTGLTPLTTYYYRAKATAGSGAAYGAEQTFTTLSSGLGEIRVPVASGSDDGFSGAWGFYNSLAWYQIGNNGSPYNGWFRFTGITIPAGAKILEARLELAMLNFPATVRLKISAEKAASPSPPTSTADHAVRVRTTAGVEWNSGTGGGAWNNSAGFAPVIQELVNSYTYSNGVIQILVDNNSGSGEHSGRTFESGSPPRLYIKYDTGSTPANHAPVLNSIGDKQVARGQLLQFVISATDPDGNPLTYSASNLPAGATFNAGTRTFSWTPAATGTYPGIHFEVSDGTLTDSEDIAITVTEPTAGDEIWKDIASGPDDGFSGSWGFYNGLGWYEVGNPGAPYNAWYRFTGITIPAGATILEAHLEVVQTRWDSGVRLKIRAEKAANPTAPTSTANHAARVRTAAGADWTTGFADSARHSSPDFAAVIQELVNSYTYTGGAIQVLVDNNGGTGESVGRTFEFGAPPRLYIKYSTGAPPANRPPVLDPIGNKTAPKNALLQFTVTASDPDGNPLVYSASNLPAGASFNAATRTFSWTPAAAGTFPGIRFEVSDGSLTDSEDIAITVTEGATVTEVRKSVAAGADDGFSGGWGFYNGTAWYEAGNPGSPYNAWFRFTGIIIPQGATVLEARLDLVQTTWGAGTRLKIRAEKAASPGAPTSTADHAGRVRTAAGIDWDSGFSDWAWHDSPDFAAVIQELVTAGYTGSSILVLVDNNGGAAEATGRTFESGFAPGLYIKYSS